MSAGRFKVLELDGGYNVMATQVFDSAEDAHKFAAFVATLPGDPTALELVVRQGRTTLARWTWDDAGDPVLDSEDYRAFDAAGISRPRWD